MQANFVLLLSFSWAVFAPLFLPCLVPCFLSDPEGLKEASGHAKGEHRRAEEHSKAQFPAGHLELLQSCPCPCGHTFYRWLHLWDGVIPGTLPPKREVKLPEISMTRDAAGDAASSMQAAFPNVTLRHKNRALAISLISQHLGRDFNVTPVQILYVNFLVDSFSY